MAPTATDTMTTSATAISSAEALAPHFSGELIDRDYPAYDTARQVWNGEIQRRPGLIARARGAADVAAAIRFAREHDLPASVRGGGHAVAGHAVLDDGIVIDLSAMTGTRVDPAARTIQAEGGTLQSDSTGRRRPSDWPRPAASSATPASPG